jgi:hypothetical protein
MGVVPGRARPSTHLPPTGPTVLRNRMDTGRVPHCNGPMIVLAVGTQSIGAGGSIRAPYLQMRSGSQRVRHAALAVLAWQCVGGG